MESKLIAQLKALEQGLSYILEQQPEVLAECSREQASGLFREVITDIQAINSETDFYALPREKIHRLDKMYIFFRALLDGRDIALDPETLEIVGDIQ